MAMDDHDVGRRRPASGWLVAGVAAGALVAAGFAWLGLTLLGSDDPPEAAGAPRFVSEADVAGIEHVYDGEFSFFVGGGVAAFDCDADGFTDLFFAGGTNPASLYRNDSTVGGELAFTQVVDPAIDLLEVVGAYPLDIDGDHHIDLAVLRLGENVLLRGMGDCRFERANEMWSFDGGSDWTAGFSAMWESPEALPTLALGNYLVLDESGSQTGTCADNQLLRPDANGYGTVTALSPGWCTLSILFSDWDRSGRRDLRMANDRHYYIDGEEQLWRVAAGEAPRLYAHDEGWKQMQIWGMGIASQDVTGDGLPEVFLTSQGDNKLQTLEDGSVGPSYTDIAIRRGVTAHRPFTGDEVLPSTAWHPEFQDVNNDGFVDLYISKGNVEAMVDYAADDPSNLLLGQPDGRFVEGASDAGIVNFTPGRGAAVVDLNLDGLLDIVEVNRRENVEVWRNIGSGTAVAPASIGNWIGVRLSQPGANVDAIGSWIEVRVGEGTVTRELTVGGGHASGQLGWVHFGLGEARHADVRVQWPDGDTGPWLELDANTFATIER
ncbi:MAG: CRTAC1 family protein, partial [Acidimicrobiia bacterium]|nr:CRTAC1 family protein [Acidimicrobiia bacterium]